jgi:hypothetical protein
VFYVIDLFGFVGAVICAVRFHEIFGALWRGAGLHGRNALVAGGLTVFVPLIVAIAIVGGRAAKSVYKPGFFTTNRVLGAAFGGALALTVVAVGLMALRAEPIPFGLGSFVQRSPLGQQVVDWVAPVVKGVNSTLDLGLCDGKLRKHLPEVCSG